MKKNVFSAEEIYYWDFFLIRKMAENINIICLYIQAFGFSGI